MPLPLELKMQKGFSLVEAIVTGAISVSVVLVVYVLINFNTSYIKATTQTLRLQEISDILVRDIQAKARRSHKIFSSSAWLDYINGIAETTSGSINQAAVYFLDTTTGQWSAVRVNSGHLEQNSGVMAAESSWRSYQVAGNNIFIKNGTPFEMQNHWKKLIATFRDLRLQSGATDSIRIDSIMVNSRPSL
jgi:hypothetical protein